MLPHRETSGKRIDFLLELARALHVYGTPAPLLEETMTQVARRLGIRATFFSMPTSLFASFGEAHHQRTALLRLDPGEVDLGRLVEVDALRRDVVSGVVKPAAGARILEETLGAPPRYGPRSTTLAFVVTSAAAGRLLGGGGKEILVAAVIGFLTGVAAIISSRRRSVGTLFEPMAAASAGFVATTASFVIGPFASSIALLAGLIVLLPGFSLTTAIRELATRHLASGTARLMGALVVFVTLAFGIVLGRGVGVAVVGVVEAATPAPIPAWTEAAALIAAGLGFAILFRTRVRDTGWVLLAVLIGYGVARYSALSLAPAMAAGCGSTAVGIAANIFSRWRQRPAAVMATPGLMVLVPGSIGFRSVEALLKNDVQSGIEGAFTMLLIATALVAGLLVANAAVAPRSE